MHRSPIPPLAWLRARGSLTAHLQRVCRDRLRVVIRAEGASTAPPKQARQLGVETRRLLWRREVELYCGNTPFVHAVTWMRLESRHALGLSRLGRRPLGHVLFRKGAILAHREIVKPRRGQPWARRTLYLLRGHRLLVQEAFLPALPPFRR